MRRYAIADEVPHKNTAWLTPGKEYLLLQHIDDDLYLIVDDQNDHLYIKTGDCAFLYGKSWRIVERES